MWRISRKNNFHYKIHIKIFTYIVIKNHLECKTKIEIVVVIGVLDLIKAKCKRKLNEPKKG